MTEETLITQLRRKKPDALEALILAYNGYVSGVITAVLGQRRRMEDVEELASDVFVSVWEHSGSIQPGKLRAYLGAAARNRAKSFLRKRQTLEMDLDELPFPDPAGSAESQVLQREQRQLVRQAVLNMQQPDREIFLRYYYYLQTSREIAEAMGMEDSTVRVRLMRGRNTLKQILSKEDIL